MHVCIDEGMDICMDMKIKESTAIWIDGRVTHTQVSATCQDSVEAVDTCTQLKSDTWIYEDMDACSMDETH